MKFSLIKVSVINAEFIKADLALFIIEILYLLSVIKSLHFNIKEYETTFCKIKILFK